MNILIYLNYRDNRYSPVDIRRWVKGVWNTCRQSNGDLHCFLLIDGNAESSLAQVGDSLAHKVFDANDVLSELQEIKAKRFDFDGILLLGRNQAMDHAAGQLSVFCIAFAKPPHPLDIWMLQSAGNASCSNGFDPKQLNESADGAKDVALPFLPSFETYYQRYTPYTGRHEDMLYRAENIKLLVPLFFYYHKQDLGNFTTPFFNRLARLARKNKQLSILLMPMSPRADKLKLFWKSAGDNTVWLDKREGRDQILSLMDKVDGVLALDNAAAILPLVLEKPVCKDMKYAFELARYLPQVKDWMTGKVDSKEYRRLRNGLVAHLFTHVAFPPHHQALLRICRSHQDLEPRVEDNARLWSVNRCYLSMVARQTMARPQLWVKKMQKFKRDPYAFCKDSAYPLVHSARWLFTPLPEILPTNRR